MAEPTRIGGATRYSRPASDPLHNVHPAQVNWGPVSAILKDARQRALYRPSFVYFIGEGKDGPIKIGHAINPVERRVKLQTGNSRLLRIEHLLYGGHDLERFLHERFNAQAFRSDRFEGSSRPDTEWFTGDARALLLLVATEIAERQLAAAPKTTMAGLLRIALKALGELPHEPRFREKPPRVEYRALDHRINTAA